MATRREKIVEKAVELLDDYPDGLRYSALVKEISKSMPEVPINTIHGTVRDLEIQQSTRIFKPSRGLYRLTKYKPDDSGAIPSEHVIPKPKLAPSVKEEDFYGPFADWLFNELEDCTKAIALGGN